MTSSVNQCYTDDMDTQELRFHRLMAILAARCKTELDAMEIEIYDKNLAGYGYDAVCRALEGILVERSSNDPFPSIGAVLSRLGAQVTPKTLAMDTTNRIITAVRTKGYNWADKVSDFEADQIRVLGEAGMAVVKRLGGWAAVIELTSTNPNYRAWIRETTSAVIETSGGKLLQMPIAEQSKIESKAK